MASKTSTAGRRYAEAAYELATRDGTLDEFGAGLELAATILADQNVLDVLRDPGRPLRQRVEVVDALLASRVPEPILKLIGLLVERGRIDKLPSVAAEYRRMLNREHGVVEALARTALPLSSDETAALEKKVAAMTGRTVDLRVVVDESLIGGLTVRVGDTLYDASVRGRLERLRERLVAGAR
jgi:F-type H+-transporting ATPase subunit delta